MGATPRTVPDLTHLSPRTLRDLAAAIEARTPAVRGRDTLSPEGVDRLADILVSGSTPTIGFYRRYAPPPPHPRPSEEEVEVPVPAVAPVEIDVGPVLEIGGLW